MGGLTAGLIHPISFKGIVLPKSRALRHSRSAKSVKAQQVCVPIPTEDITDCRVALFSPGRTHSCVMQIVNFVSLVHHSLPRHFTVLWSYLVALLAEVEAHCPRPSFPWLQPIKSFSLHVHRCSMSCSIPRATRLRLARAAIRAASLVPPAETPSFAPS